MGTRPPINWLMVFLICGLILYCGSYFVLRQRGLREARAADSEGILYISWRMATEDENLSSHQRLGVIFAPINIIDQAFGGPAPVRCIPWNTHEEPERYSPGM